MLTSLAIMWKICNSPCPSHPVSTGRAQSDLVPTPRYRSRGKQQQKPPRLLVRDTRGARPSRTATAMAGQGSACLVSQARVSSARSPDRSRGDAALCTTRRVVLAARPHLLSHPGTQAARGTQSPREDTCCPCPSSSESFKLRCRPFDVLIAPAS